MLLGNNRTAYGFMLIAVGIVGFHIFSNSRISALEKTVYNFKNMQTGVAVKKPVDAPSQNRILVVRLIGGLGNHLFLYASTYGIAHRTNRMPVVCSGYDLRQIFSNLSVSMHTYAECQRSKIPHKGSLRVKQRHSYLYYDIETISQLKASQNPNAFICCYLQNLGYFFEYEHELRAQFVIKNALKSKAQVYLDKLLMKVKAQNRTETNASSSVARYDSSKLPVFIAMHVRRGDILKQTYIAKLDLAYFQRGMNHYRRKYGSNVIFNVASDDPNWCRANIHGPDVYYTADTGKKSREEEFAIAVACNHTLMSVGTYGWWIGFLSGGDVVYYKNFVIGRQAQWFLSGQYFPHHWTPI